MAFDISGAGLLVFLGICFMWLWVHDRPIRRTEHSQVYSEKKLRVGQLQHSITLISLFPVNTFSHDGNVFGMLLFYCVCGCVDHDQHDKSEKEANPSTTASCWWAATAASHP